MDIRFEPIAIDTHFSQCVAFRRDAYLCSFGTDVGFEDSIIGYKALLQQNTLEKGWFYFHIWHESQLIGQLEFRSFSKTPDTGYVQLIYLIPEYRGLGLGTELQEFIRTQLRDAGCSKAKLSVSRANKTALRHYKRSGWTYLFPNPKGKNMDFYQLDL
jgi:GNAT superfamily N-acetyltransferase